MGTRKLLNGGDVYEFTTADTVCWVRSEKAVFSEGFRGTEIMREWVISVIVEYVPVSHIPDVLSENRPIECDSSLKTHTLLATRWIKPVQRQAPGQWCAHLITHFLTLEVANLAIREGLVRAGKRD